jgi:predicted nicotinamide N-methyase
VPQRGRAAFIRANLTPGPVPGCPGLRLYTAHPGSGLSRLEPVAPPFWAWPWPGGLALARFVLKNPGVVAGRRVLDLGAGSGLVGLAAARAGAAAVRAADIDRFARAAVRENAALNGLRLATTGADLLDGPVPREAVILAGDVVYDLALACRVHAFLRTAAAAGRQVYLGDIGRPSMPREGMERVAVFPVRDVGDTEKTPPREGGVYRILPGQEGDQRPVGSIES